MHEDILSTRIDIVCPRCQQPFKVRLRKLQFGSELSCRLCRHEFDAHRDSDLPEVQAALAHMRNMLEQRVADSRSSKRAADHVRHNEPQLAALPKGDPRLHYRGMVAQKQKPPR